MTRATYSATPLALARSSPTRRYTGIFMASPMIKNRHKRDAKRRVYGQLSSLEEPINKLIMQLNPDGVFRFLFSRVHSPFIHFRKENELRSSHFIHFYSAKQ